MIESLLFIGIFTSLLAGQFARIELINGLANVYIHEFLILIFIIWSGVRYGFAPLKIFSKTKGVLIFFILVIFSFLLSFPEFSLMQNAIASLYLVRMILYSLFGIYLFAQLKHSGAMRRILHNLIFTFSILLLIVTAIQYIFFPNFWVLYPFGWDPHLYRASAIFFDIFIAAALYGILAFYWYVRKQPIISVFFILALLLSLTRSAYIAFSISLLYFFISQKKWKEFVVVISTFLLLIVIMPKPFGEGGNLLRTTSITSRIQDYERGIALWREKPLFGFGYNRIRYAKEKIGLAPLDDRSHSLASFHSSFLTILVAVGAVGFIQFAYLLMVFYRRYPKMRVYLLYLCTMSLFDNVLLHVLVILPLLFLMADLHYSSLE